MLKRTLGALAAAVIGLNAFAAKAEYPDRPITLVVAYGAGGATDIAARNMAAVAPKYIPQPILVVNRTGAGGATGTASVKSADPDGYTMIVARVGSHTVNPAMKANLPYSIDDFRYVSVFELNPVICATSPDSGIDSMDALIERVRANPGEVTYSSSGVGSLLHIAGALVIDAFGVDNVAEAVTHLPFRGGGEAATAVVAGNATFICTNSSALMGHIQNGALTPLMVTTHDRLDGVDAPTAAELGHPELEVLVGWSGIAGPKDISDEVYDAWNNWLAEIGNDDDFVSTLKGLGSIPVQMNTKDSVAFIQKQYTEFKQLVDKLGLQVE
ncbi:MAG: tripartite tricarboxylate transporter substrate binding protein [Geminicoccaceae bacterium]|nr:tripartite tricarboxylate transporter substrate binding protein [Geminicoccaceae bacterium]MCB9945811.1 tripartite tricarboxylate transporter substrate binding protein [Geminicoccaceae bacterium]